jgi:hypothetical protein
VNDELDDEQRRARLVRALTAAVRDLPTDDLVYLVELARQIRDRR